MTAPSLPRGLFPFLGLALLGLAGCGSGSGGQGSLSVTSCSLGCSSAAASGQFNCSVTDVFVNQEIRVTFSAPVDLSSVTPNSFSVVESGTGKTPPGNFRLDPNNDRILVYRPLVTFDSSGNPSFGLKEGATYTIRMPGTNNDPVGPYVRNVFGARNTTTLSCIVNASLGVFDVKTGKPNATLTVETLTGGENQNPESDFDAAMPVVARDSLITITFDDVMNPATLVNPVTGVSETISVRIDADGNVADTSDQVELPGIFGIALDQTLLRTTVTFVPTGELPSAGSAVSKRRVVVTLPGSIQDLGGNGLNFPRSISFTPEQIVFDPEVITEDFTSNLSENTASTGSDWGGGMLVPVSAGGSGRHGALTIPAGSTVVLNTDPMVGEDFSGILDPSVFNPFSVIEPTVFGTPDPITDAVFEFSRLRIDPGGTLRFVGPIPPRVYVRGEVLIQGLFDVSGAGPGLHDSTDEAGAEGGEAGPGGGGGGAGGDRPDGEAFVAEGGVDSSLDPVLYTDVDGKDGTGTPTADMMSLVAGGEGGLAWPQPTADFPTFGFPVDINDTGGMQFESQLFCQTVLPGAAGGGGGHAFDGGDGDTVLLGEVVISDPADPPPVAAGGDNTDLMIDDDVRTLDPEMGYLRGGGGGGGGGAHLQETSVNGAILDDCTMTVDMSPLVINSFLHHSSAAGGGGGGGMQLQIGRRLVLDGVLDASGGTGGGTLSGMRAQAGGGGAGGGLLVQAPQMVVAQLPGRFDVSGGTGGTGVNLSKGGNGSPGILRLEFLENPPTVASVESMVAPTDAQVLADYPASNGIDDVLTVGDWMPLTDGSGTGADQFSGAESCWLRAAGNLFTLTFSEDGGDFSLPNGLGWDLMVRVDGQANPQSYRGVNDISGMPLEDFWGDEIGDAPFAVRFQGARALGALPDPCNPVLAGLESEIFEGSLTGWVKHPEELNDFFGDDPVLKPNMFRFIVIWDASDPVFGDIEAIEGVEVAVQPD